MSRKSILAKCTCLVIAGWSVAALSGGPAHALPKGGGGGGSKTCECTCTASANQGAGMLASTNKYNSNGLSCGALENRTCNMNDPTTGGIATGTLIGCFSASGARGAILMLSPFTGAQVLRKGR